MLGSPTRLPCSQLTVGDDAKLHDDHCTHSVPPCTLVMGLQCSEVFCSMSFSLQSVDMPSVQFGQINGVVRLCVRAAGWNRDSDGIMDSGRSGDGLGVVVQGSPSEVNVLLTFAPGTNEIYL